MSKTFRGARGPAGPQGERGPKGERGLQGDPGRSGPRCKTGTAAQTDRAALLAEVDGHIEDIYRELDVQMKRMSQIQQQVDELREKVKRPSE